VLRIPALLTKYVNTVFIIHILTITNCFDRFIMFNKFCIPKENLLSKTGDINEDGKYVSPFKDKSKRLGNVLCIVCSIIYTL